MTLPIPRNREQAFGLAMLIGAIIIAGYCCFWIPSCLANSAKGDYSRSVGIMPVP